ncbi:4Fe-4S binding protein [Ancylomarina longa]|uniref:4Fe-4S dicluster domain-containing protein n=1 Tax=Ancylomarina longa TaxID=2487017 RepID=A0A434AVX4_9BACT|nr:4Fe-4S dicluster domain-containing protein [Ancylomarina longa]RUT78646.1 4Fe-4S dicluster domain-containing protein [Ancylomarina longa]
MAKFKGAIVVETEKCKGCSLCVVACPTGVIELARDVNAKGYHYAYMANPDACIGCSSCGLVCPDTVITVYRTKAS